MKDLIKNIIWLIITIGIMILMIINGLFEQNVGGILFTLLLWGYGMGVFIYNIYTIIKDKKEQKKNNDK